jgi:type I restriction enzyme S subunit
VPGGRNLCLGQRTVLLKIDGSLIEPELVVANIYSQRVQDHFSVQMSGSTVGNLRLPVIRGTTIAVPPKHVQDGLVAEYRRIDADTGQLVARIARFIDLACERRAALITAAVTGQISVGEAA